MNDEEADRLIEEMYLKKKVSRQAKIIRKWGFHGAKIYI